MKNATVLKQKKEDAEEGSLAQIKASLEDLKDGRVIRIR